MTGVTVAFESKVPHKTPWLSIEFPVGEEPAELLSELAQLGWVEDKRFQRVPPLDGRQEVMITAPSGTDLFLLWTDDEAKKYMPPVRRLLRRHSFDRVPWNRLTLADMI